MNINSKILAKALYQSILDTPDKESEVVKEFIKYLEEKNLIGLLPSVVKNLEHIQRRAVAQEKIKVTISQKLSTTVIEEIKEYIFVNIGNGRDRLVQTDIIEDPDLVGGFVAEYNDKIYDGSVKGQLEMVRKKLLNNNSNQ